MSVSSSAAARVARHLQHLEAQIERYAQEVKALREKLRAEQIAKANALNRARDAERKVRTTRSSSYSNEENSHG